MVNNFILEFFKGEETDRVSPYIEDCIARQEPILKVRTLAEVLQCGQVSLIYPTVYPHFLIYIF